VGRDVPSPSNIFPNVYYIYLPYKRRYVYLFVCLLPMAGRTAGSIKTKLDIGTHVDPGSVLVKVKVVYLCVRYNRVHDRIRDRKFMSAPSGEQRRTTREAALAAAVAQ